MGLSIRSFTLFYVQIKTVQGWTGVLVKGLWLTRGLDPCNVFQYRKLLRVGGNLVVHRRVFGANRSHLLLELRSKDNGFLHCLHVGRQVNDAKSQYGLLKPG